ncbi:cysteine hydrolase [Leptolyngbya sp. FACHB-261]|uniref:cysteine hydrolase n=1 Tax=Leptolyngbya sp. FACHB-261 TaxID=2692806 RepID=UPI0016837DB8|nr:cysteine hydrolase [Leptolyngbya sp. FACHB-261]MBD2103083.1 cysteine hydrolase [Leptolyngbya sp. FACHB-261]
MSQLKRPASETTPLSTNGTQKLATPLPELHPQWQSLDLAAILAEPTAFLSISQNNSLYSPKGAQAREKQWERPSLENTIKVAEAARSADAKFFWIGYDVFRQSYPKTVFDEAQYRTWYEPYRDWSEEQKRWDGELVDELKSLKRPDDVEFFETAHQSSFIGTTLPLYLSRWGIRNLLITGIHLDWCIEGNARAARDHGFLPIVIGDACACQNQEDEPAALRRINTFFAPVISAETAVELLGRSVELRTANRRLASAAH